ncbi:MAG: hypothetical protein U0637_04465 [Phycisphaerales bacterium]
MQGWQIALLVAGFFLMDFMVVGAIMHFAVQAVLEPLARDYPPLPAAPSAVRREFQSMERDRLNFGWCVHMTADECHLHIEPAWLLRACGGKPCSVPWTAMEVVKRGRWSCRVKVAGKAGGEYRMPAWVGELIEGDPPAA